MNASYQRPTSRYLLEDGVLVSATVAGLWMSPSPLWMTLSMASACCLLWQLATLHAPHRIELSDQGVAFFGYGRVHRYPWRKVTGLTVRRFVTGDRLLVRIAPASPWSGRYWIFRSAPGFDELALGLAPHESRSLQASVNGPDLRT